MGREGVQGGEGEEQGSQEGEIRLKGPEGLPPPRGLFNQNIQNHRSS